MNYEELVQLITKEVMGRLKAVMAEEASANLKKVLVLEKKEDLCPVITGALRDKNYIVDCIDTMGDLSSYDGILLQNLSNGEFANLSHGIEGSIKEKLAIQAIFSGNRIYCMEKGVEYKKYAETSNKLFFNLFKGYEDKLKSYGINFVGLKELFACLGDECREVEKNACTVEGCPSDLNKKAEDTGCCREDLSTKKLVSEVELRNICKRGINEVIVSKRTILTPLAMDYARVNKIKITKR